MKKNYLLFTMFFLFSLAFSQVSWQMSGQGMTSSEIQYEQPNPDDDAEATDYFQLHDLGITAILSPVSGYTLGYQDVIIEIQNFGMFDEYNVPVEYSIDGGMPVPGMIPFIGAGSIMVYIFPDQAWFPSWNTYMVVARSLLGDENPMNNEMTVFITISPPPECVNNLGPQDGSYWTGSCTAFMKTEPSLIYCVDQQDGWVKFDLAGIPSGAYIYSVEFNGYVLDNDNPQWAITSLPMDPVAASPADIYAWTDDYMAHAYGIFYEPGTLLTDTFISRPLNAQAVADLQAALVQGWFAIGINEFENNPANYITFEGWDEDHEPFLRVIYGLPLDLSGALLRAGDYLNPDMGHNWIDPEYGDPGASTPVRLHILDVNHEINYVEFYFSYPGSGGPQLFFTDYDGFEPPENTLITEPAGDGWTAYFPNNLVPPLTSPETVTFMAQLYLHSGQVTMVYPRSVIWDPTPPSSVTVNIPDWYTTTDDHIVVDVNPVAANISYVNLLVETKPEWYYKGVPLIGQKDASRTYGGNYHCAPTAAASCLTWLDPNLTGGLCPKCLTNALAGLAGTNADATTGTSPTNLANAMQKWIDKNGGGYEVRGPMAFNWKEMRGELERDQDVLSGIWWDTKGKDGKHRMTMNSIKNTPYPDGDIMVDFMDPWTGAIEFGWLNPTTGKVTCFTGAGSAGDLENIIIVCPKKASLAKGVVVPGPDPVPTLLALPDTGLYWLRIEIEDLDGNNARTDLVVRRKGIEGFQLSLKAFLQGPYNTATGTMHTDIAAYLPLQQPYGPALPYFGNPDPVWYYTGTESVATIPAGIVDWVMVELRDAPSPDLATSATTVQQRAAFLREDGVIVDLDGASPLAFTVTPVYNLYAVVFHRNHLGILSSAPIPASGAYREYDFTLGSGQVYGGAVGYKELAPGVWGMLSGNGNGDGQTNNADKVDVWNVQAGLSGYRAGDLNLSGQVDNVDKVEFWRPNSGLGSQVPL
jgi:hypothetical protein